MQCPMSGCHSEGWCVHKTMMMLMMIAVIAGLAWYFLK